MLKLALSYRCVTREYVTWKKLIDSWTCETHHRYVTYLRKIWSYQRCNQKAEIKGGQTTQSPKEKVQQEKQSTIHYIEN
jgi:hypothetical protein